MIDQPTIDRILDAANIVDVVSEFVTLRKRGVNFVGLCPFHADKTPSFYVSPSKNICKCFACGEGGTAVHFIMKHEQLNYYDALRYLAKKYNIEIQEKELTNEEKRMQSERESLFIVNEWAQKYFTNLLHEHAEGRSVGLRYFAERGLREDTIRKFQLGYSLDQRDALFKEAVKSGYKKEFLEKNGLILVYENGNVNDRFRGRVIFPVHTLSGKVVAFGGRVLKKDEKAAKYVNSPESEIYHKSNELYGLYFAKRTIVKEDKCFLVEGYMDVIGMHQVGIENVVASSGTALTSPQIRLIHRFTKNITVLYDGDAAGIKAALRGIDMLLEEGMNIKVVLLPDGEDPDSFARSRNATQFAEFIRQNETDFIRFKTKLLLGEAGKDPIKRSALISDIIRSIAVIPDNIARSVYIRECSVMLEIDEKVILNEVNKIILSKVEKSVNGTSPVNAGVTGNAAQTPSLPTQETAVEGKASVSPYQEYELTLLRYIVRYGERVLYQYQDEETSEEIVYHVADYIKNELERDDLTFYTPLYQQIMEEAADKCKESGFVASKYFLSHPDPEVSLLTADLVSDKYQLSKYHFKFRNLEQEEDRLEQIINHDLYAMKGAYIQVKRKELQAQLREIQGSGSGENGNSAKLIEIIKRLKELDEIKTALSKQLGERIVLKM